jgi:hypothetical protein
MALTLATGLGLAAGFTAEAGDFVVDLVILVGMEVAPSGVCGAARAALMDFSEGLSRKSCRHSNDKSEFA